MKISKVLKLAKSQKISCLTSYSYNIAKLLNDICDIILVGDSLGMALYGMENTRQVTLQMMIDHGKAVVKGAKNPLIVVDMPFGSYEKCKDQALENAKKIISQTKCDAVKIEINEDILPILHHLCKNNIAVMGHIGLLPQTCLEARQFQYQGRDDDSAQQLIELAKKIEEFGAFSVVIEAVPKKVADQICQSIKILTIGIGASINCDGQILVSDDMLGINENFKPRFLKKYFDMAKNIRQSAKNYKKDVISKTFPGQDNML